MGGSNYGGINITTCLGVTKQTKMGKSCATERQRQDFKRVSLQLRSAMKTQRLALKPDVASALTALNLHNFFIEEDSNTSKNLVSPI